MMSQKVLMMTRSTQLRWYLKVLIRRKGPSLRYCQSAYRARRKKLREIRRLEKKIGDGETISTAQQDRINRKGDLSAEVEELENLKKLLPQAIAEELIYNSIIPTDTSETASDSEGTEAHETSAKNGPTAVGDAEADAPSITHNPAQGDLEPEFIKRFYNFFRRYKLEGDDKNFYHGDAMALVSRRSFRVHYSDLYTHDKKLAMEICADYERLRPSMTEAAKRFCRETLKKTIKSLTRQKENAVSANLESLKLILTGKPKSHQMLNTMLEPRSVVMVEVDVHSDKENPMKTPSDLGASLLVGTLEDLVSKHLQGLSHNGNFSIGNVEVYNSEKYVINSTLVTYVVGTEAWAEACKKDFKCHSDTFMPLFKTGEGPEAYPPYMRELKTALATVPVHVIRNRKKCLAFHEFVPEHMAAKPIPVRAALVSGIHNCCKSYDLNDPKAPYKKLIHEMNDQTPELSWTSSVLQSGNKLMEKFLTKRMKNGKEIEVKYSSTLESMSTYLRVLYEHGSDYMKDRKEKNKDKRRNTPNQRNSSNPSQNSAQNRQAPNPAPNRRASNPAPNPAQNQLPQNQRAKNQPQNQRAKNQPQNQRANQQPQNQRANQQPQNQSQNQLPQNQPQNQWVNQPPQNQRANQHPQNQSQNQLPQNQPQNQLPQNPAQNNLHVLDEPQLQRLKRLDELELIGARHLGPFVCELIYTLLKNDAMTGMMETIWKAYKNCKISNKAP